MSEQSQPVTNRRAELQTSIFSKNMPWRQTCVVITDLTRSVHGRGFHLRIQQDPVGLVDAFDRWLISRGGDWAGAEIPAGCIPPPDAPAGGTSFEPVKIAHPDETFDLLVMVKVLENVPDDRALVAECHRVLKPGGHLVMVVRRTRPWSLLRPLRRLCGVSDQTRGRARAGYSESALFDTLKDGFDVEDSLPYSRFFTQAADIPVQRSFRASGIAREAASGAGEDDERILMAYRRADRSGSFWYPWAWLASKLDLLLVASRGHALAVRARRRQWRPRRAPTLKDGRSIAEATINTKIGTAAPF